jgi:tetratricopeptide (TPR) repeat protein
MLGMAVVPYLHTLSADFIWDDDFLIKENPYIKSLEKADDLFSLSYWISENPGTPGQYRPLRAVIFAVEYGLWGLNPLGYRLTNMAVYLLCVYLVYVLAKRMFADRLTALLAGMLFGLHPAHTEVTAWIKNLTELLACLFVLLGLWGLTAWEKGKGRWGYLLSLAVLPLALVSKETSVVYPLLLGAWVLHEGPIRPRLKGLLGLLPHAMALASYTVFLFLVLGKRVDRVPAPEMGLWEHAYVVLWTAWVYLRDLFFPLYLNAEHLIPMPPSATDPVPWVSGASLLALGLLWYRTRKVHPPSAFALAWIVIALLPVLNIRYITGRPLADQRVFMASVGTCWLLGHWMQRLLRGSYPGIPVLQFRVGAWALVGMIMAMAGLATFHRNYVWTDPMLLYADTIKKSPKAERAHYNLGNTYKSREEWDKAIQAFKRAIHIQPNFVGSHNNLGLVYAKIGDLENAEREYLTALMIQPKAIPTLMNLGNLYLRMGRLQLAQEQFQKVLSINPEISDAYLHLGDVRAAQGRWQEAEGMYRRALEVDPRNQDARAQLSEARLRLQEHRDASLREVDLLLERDPHDYEGWVMRGNILAQKGQIQEAIAAYDRAMGIDPLDFRAYVQKGLALEVAGDLEGAKKEYGKAISMDSGSGMGRVRMASVLLHQGKLQEAEANLQEALRELPHEPEPHLLMAKLYLERDDEVGKALYHLGQVARMAPHHPQIDEIKRIIQFLREAEPRDSGDRPRR